MADPLSVSASISGLLNLADIVFQRTYKYVKAVKKGPKEISALSTEIGALYGVLSSLHQVSRQLEHEQVDSSTRIHHIHSCYQTLDRVKSILDKDDTSSLRDERLETLKRKLRWPFTSSEVKELIAEIERHKTTLGLALNVDCMSGLLQALSKNDEIRDTIGGIRVELKERHEAETRIAVNKETEEILKSFVKVDSRSNFEMSRKLRSPGTGLWLTEGEEFRQWLETKNARLWLYGIPGAGKTVLASSVIEEALRTTSSSTAVAFFYCDYKNAGTQDLSNILGSLAQQFAKQDETSFAKLRHFYKTHNPEHRPDFKYDSEALLDLVRAVTLDFDCPMIIVDGLDECGTNTPLVVDALTTLNDGGETTVKTLFLSRDEIEIRERLEEYTKVSIAASSSDLRLYVGAEIDLRTRKKRLRIKDQSLKEHIFERLVEGAEGMFRWVACQMDYMCELPNDEARRKALSSLPPDLNSTYERILNRVNQSNPETQKMVRRALRWISNYNMSHQLTTEALCEAVSIEFGDTKRNSQAVPDEFDILHWCSSLVRKSSDGKRLELAHFTVLEFLKQNDSRRDVSIGAYRMDTRADEAILAKVQLTYLNFEDFDQGGPFDEEVVERRFQEYPFRRYAIRVWLHFARHGLDDNDFFQMLQKLLNPSKPNTLISWMHDFLYLWVVKEPQDEENISRINSGVAETTPLHWAAMFGLKRMCSWLIGSGCDVNRNTEFGTPLHCALLGFYAVDTGAITERPLALIEPISDDVFDLLLEAGADPNSYHDLGTKKLSSIFIALSIGNADLVMRLLDRGGVFDDDCLNVLESNLRPEDPDERANEVLNFEDIRKIIERLNGHNLHPDHYGRLLQLALKAKTTNATRLMQKDEDLPLRDAHYEQTLRTAAEVGQVEVVTRLLEDHKIDVDSADEKTGLTALHQATRTDQLVVAELLIDHGADWSRSDSVGRTALHHSLQKRGLHCFQYLLHQDADTSLRDIDGMTVWHLAAQEGNVQALRMLLSGPVNSASTLSLRTNDGRTPLLCASASESKEAVTLLLSAGSSLTETASDGSSLLHYAAESGCLEVIKYLLAQTVDAFGVTHDGSNAIHYAIKGSNKNLAENVRILLHTGIDPSRPRNGACTPLHDLVRQIRKYSPSSVQLGLLFAASRTLLESLLEKSKLASVMELGSELLYLACSESFPSAHETVLALLEIGLDPNIRFEDGRTALMAAAESGHEAIFSTLLLHGSDPCVRDSNLCTALHYACLNDHRSILVLLRDTNIDWNSQATATISGVRCEMVTALHIAAEIKDSEVVEYLLNESPMLNINPCTGDGATPLSAAVWAEESQNVSFLLSKGADTTLIDVLGNSAVHEAAEHGSRRIIDEFIRHGSNLGLSNSHGLTPELLARKNGHMALANIIMDYVTEQNSGPNGASHSQRPEKSREPLEALKVAIDVGDLELCSRLVESGTDLKSGFGGCKECTPLLYSLHQRKLAIAEYLISQGATIAGHTCEFWPTRGFTAFHYAAMVDSAVLLQLLLEKAPRDVYSSYSPIHPIHLAVLNDNAECVKLMLDHASEGKGSAPSDQPGTLRQALAQMVNVQVRGDMLRWSWYGTPGKCFPWELLVAKPLHIAASRGYAHIARMLLQYGASIDCGDGNLRTPLHYAAGNGQTSMVQLLLDAGANPNVVDLGIMTPCMDASRNGHVDSVRVLIKGGADVQLRTEYGATALQFAASDGAKDVFVLLMTGSDLCAEDELGRSTWWEAIRQTWAFPMSFVVNLAPPSEAYECQRYTLLNAAVANRTTSEVKMLLRRVPTGLLPRLLDLRAVGGTPLHFAALLSKLDTMKLLLDAGAQLELEGSEHGTPLMAACATGRLAAIKLLVARGARTSYVKDGEVYSAFTAAKYHPQVRRWLLVGRFLEGPKLLRYKDVE